MRIESRAVKKLLLIGVGSALMIAMGGVGPAMADAGVHVSTAVGAGATATMTQAGGNRCAGCHRAHTAKANNLLKEAQPALCYSCHGGVGAGSVLDVVDGSNVTAGGALRGGGFQFALINGAGAQKTMGTVLGKYGLPVAAENVPLLLTKAPVTSNHQVDGTSTGTMWGNGAISAVANPGQAGVTLECASCHDPHGNGNYRILKPIPNNAGTQAADILIPAVIADPTANPPVVGVPAVLRSTTGVAIPDAATKVYTTADYWLVTDRTVPVVAGGPAPLAAETDGYVANVAAWCTTCHTRYYAPSGSAGVASGDALFSYRHASNRSDKSGVSRPNCIQCHVSHGSNVAMTGAASTDVAYPGQADSHGNAAPLTTADSRLLRVDNRGTCVMCHNV